MSRHLTRAAVLLGVAAAVVSCGRGPIESKLDLSPAAARGRVLLLNKSTPRCSTCHMLRDAGAGKMIGPNLDTHPLDHAKVLRALKQGVGAMPTQSGILSDQEMSDIATYVVEAAGK
ncbi:MAG: cytochrome c [Planctomycetota bacterium]|nr:cytochrome c [Planctomycetota bacterium]